MAVILRQTLDLGAGPQELRVFVPKGMITKSEREQAERLDEFLRRTISSIYDEMRKEGSLSGPEFWKWYHLGRRLRFVDDTSLVKPEDKEAGYIWEAIREHCPEQLRPSPERRGNRRAQPQREGHSRDHYRICYEAGQHRWEDINWIPRWSDWMSLVESPGVIRDARILRLLASAIGKLGRSLGRDEFRRLLKALRKPFSTHPVYTDPTTLPDNQVEAIVREALNNAGLTSL